MKHHAMPAQHPPALADLPPWQFRISDQPEDGAQPVGDRWLCLGPNLPVVAVQDTDGHDAGLLLGFGIDLAKRELINSTWRAPVGADLGTDAGVLQALMALAGRFVWICTTRGAPRLYLDAAGQIPAVYDARAGLAGTSAIAILSDAEYDARFDHVLYDALRVDGEGWFPGGLTAHTGVTRLLPNHYLDLATMTPHRFWRGARAGEHGTPDAIVNEIISLIDAQYDAICKGPQQPVVGLTAGYETRAMLACARDRLDQLQFVTITGEDRHHIDGVIAGRLAADLGLKHRAIPRVSASVAAREAYLRRLGHCNGDSNGRYFPSVAPLYPDHVFFSGVGGETARAPYWRDSDTGSTPITPVMLMKRFGLPHNDRVEAALDEWLQALGPEDTFVTLDLIYIEHRIAPWSSVQFSGDPTLVRHAPMFCYRSVALMQALPHDWKRGNRLAPAIIARRWSALADYPFNTAGPLRNLWVKVTRLIDDPRLVLKKLRQMRG